MAPVAQPLIASITVENLFGLYSYRLPPEGALPNGAILYGDNGLGKTTILRLVFHLLSSAGNRGHRTALYNIPFNRLEVTFSSGVTATARRARNDLVGLLTLEIASEDKRLATWEFEPGIRGGRVPMNLEAAEYIVERRHEGVHRTRKPRKPPAGRQRAALTDEIQEYLQTLETQAPVMFMLNADRRLESDSVADPSDELELRRVMMYEEPRRLSEFSARAREIGLSQALGAATRFISTKAFQSANRGSTDVHSVYVNVIRHLASAGLRDPETPAPANVDDLTTRLISIESKTGELARYELATPLSTEELQVALKAPGDPSHRELAASLLAPYVQSLEKRLEATSQIYEILHRLVTIVNGFLRDKFLEFKLSQGFVIKNRLGQALEPSQLSSGEQQLLLLFCYILTGRDKPSVFMVDEPELSLNVKWQRQLIQSLLDIAEESATQFLFASHSLELLAQHRSRVVQLVSTL